MSDAITMSVEDQVKHLCVLLKEYAEKLVDLKRQEWTFAVPSFGADQRLYDPLAWWLDECHRMKKPLLAMVSSASQTLEHLPLDTFQSEELALRLAEIEVHLHHVLRRFHYWSERVAKDKSLKSLIDPLRAAYGLPVEVTR
jgi:hypothetical protein